MTLLSPDERRVARHALGLPNAAFRSYRNRFYTQPGTADWFPLTSLLARGLATRVYGDGPYAFFYLTRAGAELALAPGESLDPQDFPRSP